MQNLITASLRANEMDAKPMSASFALYHCAVSAQTAVEGPVSTQDLVPASILVGEIDATAMSTEDLVTTALFGVQTETPMSSCEFVKNLILGDKLTETPHLFPEQADKQAVEPLKLLPAAREYVDTVGKWDILSERGGKANHHSGNKRYRKVVSEMRAMYRDTAAKRAKTDLSKSIMEYVGNYGARFLKKDKDGHYFVMTKTEARKKTSQALRETKQLKWTDVDVEDDVQV